VGDRLLRHRWLIGWLFLLGSLVWLVGAIVIFPSLIVTAIGWAFVGWWYFRGIDLWEGRR
jgi:hypothetical protein